jgi:hypothetical protein
MLQSRHGMIQDRSDLIHSDDSHPINYCTLTQSASLLYTTSILQGRHITNDLKPLCVCQLWQ